MATVYQHRNLETGEVFYIGIAKTPKRPYDRKMRSAWWKSYTGKYAYNVEILYEDITWERACEIEKELIAFYGRKYSGQGCLLNMTDGGEGRPGPRQEQEKAKHRGWKHTPEALAKIKKARRSRESKPFSEEHKANISKALKGIKRGKRSEEHTAKIVAKKRGIKLGPRPEEIKNKISQSKKGMKWEKKSCPNCGKLISLNGNNFKRHETICNNS